MSGAQALIECLREEKVDVVFGYPGGQIMEVYDRLFDAPVRHILARHEQGAVHAADGFARATGRPGVVLATSGPGATNLVTGLANAYMDSVPLIAITGQVPTPLIGTDAFQEADITGITLPITKHNYLVKEARDIPRVMKEAFHIATTGRPGPVLVDLPKDITQAKFDFAYPAEVDLVGYKPTFSGHPRQIREAAASIMHAKRPLLYVGGGAVTSSGAPEALLELVTMVPMPVTTTLMGLSAFPPGHPLSLGMLGMHGTVPANYAVTHCDLLIAIGARFDDRVTGKITSFAPDAKVVHIDVDPAEIGKNVRVDVPIVGDAGTVLRDLIERLTGLIEAKRGDGHPDFKLEYRDWLSQVAAWQRDYPLTYGQKPEGSIKPQFILDKIHEVTAGDAIVTTEVGQHQMWAAQYHRMRGVRSFITSGGLGTMGFGFPAAIGAQIGRPDKTVFAIAGDGSFQMNIQELATAVNNRLPIKIAILNNEFLGMVRQWQALFYNHRYSSTCLRGNPDFVKLAEAYGAAGLRAERPEDVQPTLEAALRITDRPVVMDFRIDREEDVFPMVPPGGTLNKMLGVGGDAK